MNFSRALVPLQRFNCAWIEYDVSQITFIINGKELDRCCWGGGGSNTPFILLCSKLVASCQCCGNFRWLNNSNLFSQVNGTLKITAREVRDEEKERKAMTKIHLDLILSGISTVVVVICLILLSCLRYSVSLILRSVTNVPINSTFQHPPGTLLAFECRL